VSDPLDDSNATGVNGDPDAEDSGAVYVFVRNETTWTQQAYLKTRNPSKQDFFGCSVSISEDTIVVGAYLEDSNATGVNGDESNDDANGSGAAYVFVRQGTSWTQQAYLKANNTRAYDYFGCSVSISGDTIVVGAYKEDSNATGVNGNLDNDGVSNSGAAYVFIREGNTWMQQTYLKASNTEEDDKFGWSVSISGGIIVVGAPYEDSNTTGMNGDQSDNHAGESGAAYVFMKDCANDVWSQQAYLKSNDIINGAQFGVGVTISDEYIVVGPGTVTIFSLTPDIDVTLSNLYSRESTALWKSLHKLLWCS
jgi:hypothetical protein